MLSDAGTELTGIRTRSDHLVQILDLANPTFATGISSFQVSEPDALVSRNPSIARRITRS